VLSLDETKIAIIGLGYVGLPLAVEFAKKLPVVGFDINESRVDELRSGIDSTLEVSDDEFSEAKYLSFSSDVNDIKAANVYIVTVPTPIDKHKKPDLRSLQDASLMLGSVIKKGDFIIYESTVYPGATEEICVPIIEQESGLFLNDGFFVGYSPERINPGDKKYRVSNILKITSGSTPEAADFIDSLYKNIIVAGTHKASSIKVAEAAKVIENIQRDVNIALINELALIFSRLGIDTLDVLEAAETKWNFLPFRPGLVGGHCIGVDPYYLVHKAQETGFEPSIIPASRYTNEYMASHIVQQVIKLMSKKRISIVDANILIMGLAFKENCPDLRNTKIVDMVEELTQYNANVELYDPWVDYENAKQEYGIDLVREPEKGKYDAVIIAVSHRQFQEMGAKAIHALGKKNHVLYDVKYILKDEDIDGRL